MAKLYVFGIGGTGSRVIRSLTMMLASGTKLKNNFNQIVPIIIDPDLANGNKEGTLSLIENYNKIRRSIKDRDSGFFGTRITSFKGGDDTKKDSFIFKLEGSNQTFKDFLGYDQLYQENSINKDLVDLLYSDENLRSNMKVGFKGNPNIGSVVLNQIGQSEDFENFLNHFEKGDAIFIVSSIFGGTGASGFPTLLKNLRKPDANSEKQVTVRDSKIGALSVLPYFRLNSADEIDDNTFLSKTKAALDYYSDSLLKEHSEVLDSLYLIGDSETNIVNYAVGDSAQKNPSHFIELASAWGVFDFSENLNDGFKIKEYGLGKKPKSSISIEDLGDDSQPFLHDISKLKLLANYFDYSISDFKSSRGSFKGKLDTLSEDFLNSMFFKKDLKKFLTEFKNWLNELKDQNNRTTHFDPFKDISNHKELLDFRKGIVVKNRWFQNNSSGNKLFKASDKAVDKFKNLDTAPEIFTAVMYEIINQEIKN